MSSAENGKPAGRLVWITDKQADRWRNRLALSRAGEIESDLAEVLSKWDAAPADPASELAQRLAVVMGCPMTLDEAALVLQALGVPSPSPTRSDNA